MKTETESFSTGIFFTLLSAIGLAFVGLFGKLGIEQYTLTALIFWRYGSTFLLYFSILALMKRLEATLHFGPLKMNFARAFFMVGAQMSFFFYIQSNSLLNGMVLLNMSPIFISIIDWAVLRRHVGKSTWAGVLIAFIGAVCILQPDQGIFSWISLIGLFAGLCQGISQVLFGFNAKDERPDLGLLYLFFFCALLSAIPYLIFHTTWESGKSFTPWAFGLIVLIAISSISNQTTRAIAYRHGTPSRLSPFLYAAVPVAGLFDWLFFERIPNLLTIIGTLLVISGGFLKIFLRHKIRQEK